MANSSQITTSIYDVHNSQTLDAIAVVGMAARLPEDAETVSGLWKVMQEARNTAIEIPSDRTNIDAFYHPNAERPDTYNVRKASFVKEDVAAFDASFFSIQPLEAEAMDPQHRWALELSYQAFENAGIPMEKAAGSNTAVYVASASRDYENILHRDPEQQPRYMGTGVGTALLSNRLSWFFDLRGPSATIDTACSGSLVALHLACQSLRYGESDMALCGGASLILSPESLMTQLTSLGFLSPDGISYSFDSRANGYARGEGVGMVVLKRMSDAIKDNDTIRGVIRATSVNQDGRTPGISQPSSSAQTANILQAYKSYGLELDHTGYFEAHGTGTPVGDPLEAQAIHEAFQRSAGNPLHIGSVKANIGHLEAAAGIAALIKSILLLEHGILPPNAAFEEPNPQIPLDQWHLRLSKLPLAFPPQPGGIRRVSINNFGYGGTNGHIVVDDALSFSRLHRLQSKHHTIENPSAVQNRTDGAQPINGYVKHDALNGLDGGGTDSTGPFIILWSASDEAGLQRLVETYNHYFNQLPKFSPREANQYLTNLAYTLCTRRSSLSWKSYAVVNSVTELQEISKRSLATFRSSSAPSISFVFTGQGPQWYGMTRGLERYLPFRESLGRSAAHLGQFGCPWNLLEELGKDEKSSRVNEPDFSQPLCTALQIALVDLLDAWGIQPVGVVGHSSGEIAAAYCVGSLSQCSAMSVAYHRGRCVAKMAKAGLRIGGMLSVNMAPEKIAAHIEEANKIVGATAQIGCVNCPENVTVTGDVAVLDHVDKTMYSLGIFSKRVNVTVAYHSYHMEDCAAEYSESLQFLPSMPTGKGCNHGTRMFSSVTGDMVDPSELSKRDYWVRNLVKRVNFTQALQSMVAFLLERRKPNGKNLSGKDLLLELGAHSALRVPVMETLRLVDGAKNIEYDATGYRGKHPVATLAEFSGKLRCRGVQLDLNLFNSPGVDADQMRVLADLPVYPFNHTQRYWCEGRKSVNHRLRKFGRHDFLGVRELNWIPNRPQWRNPIRITEHPWVSEYKLGDSGVYPVSGLLVMAIEAARQLLSQTNAILGYRLDHVSFPTRFVVPEDIDMLEAQIYFDPQHDPTYKTITNEFSIFGEIDKEWHSLCTGTIIVEIDDKHDDIRRKVRGRTFASIENQAGNNLQPLSHEVFYDGIEAMQYHFSSDFRRLSELELSETGAVRSKLHLRESYSSKDNQQLSSHVIHPTQLDAILQSSIAVMSQCGRRNIPLIHPTAIRSLWIAHDLINYEQDANFQTTTTCTSAGFAESEFALGVVDEQKTLLVLVEGLKQQTVDTSTMISSSNAAPKRLNYRIEWKQDESLLEPDSLRSLCEDHRDPLLQPSAKFVDQLELVALYWMHQASNEISNEQINQMPKHLQKYVSWIQHQLTMANNGTLEKLRYAQPENERLWGNSTERSLFLDELSNQSPVLKLAVETGRNLMSMLLGRLDPLELLFSTDLASAYYETATKPALVGILPYLDVLAHKNPSLNILEVGAGTGAATKMILPFLTERVDPMDGTSYVCPRYKQYTYTDVTSAFFENAKQNFKQYPNVKYAVLDVETDPMTQGFEDHQFDLVIASGVLHATASLQRTMQNIHKLMKPGGKLIMAECTKPQAARVSFTFGLLKGWWLSEEEERNWCPCVSQDTWKRVLDDVGFDNFASFPDNTDSLHETYAAMICTATAPVVTIPAIEELVVLASGESELQQAVAANITRSFNGNVRVLTKFEPLDLPSKFCQIVVLFDLDHATLVDVEDETWMKFKDFVIWATRNGVITLWVSKSLQTIDPKLAYAKGMIRVISSEYLQSDFTDLTVTEDSPETIASNILNLLKYKASPSNVTREREYLEQNGTLQIPRVVEAANINRILHDAVLGPRTLFESFSTANRALELSMLARDDSKTIQWNEYSPEDTPLAPDEVEIKVEAVGVNPKDIEVFTGLALSTTLGSECAGVITRVGSDSLFQVGDKVCCFASGCFKTYARTSCSTITKFPDRFSFVEAASLLSALSVAYYSLVITAKCQEGDSLLILHGSGAIGQAAIQVARLLKAHVLTTVNTDEERTLIHNTYGLPKDQIFDSYNEQLAFEITQSNHPEVNIIFDTSSAGKCTVPLDCLAPLGQIVRLQNDATEPLKLPFAATLHQVDMELVLTKAKPVMKRIIHAISELLEDIILVKPLNLFNLEQVNEAFEHERSMNATGKTVVQFNPSDQVKILPLVKTRSKFHSRATYVIAGGFGGLGRGLITWMVGNGARNFLVLSRSGAKKDSARSLIEEMREQNIRIEAPQCDITDENTTAMVIKNALLTMPAIRGCLQAAMVYELSTLENMSVDFWHKVHRPKTIGTVNLGACLPKNMDFFVLLSSISGAVGPYLHAPYVAANIFQDEYARSLASQGRHCVSVNLGVIKDIGFAAERDLEVSLRHQGFEGVLKDEFFALLDYCCDPACVAARDPRYAHLISGLSSAETLPGDHFRSLYWVAKPMFAPLVQLSTLVEQAKENQVADEVKLNLTEMLRSSTNATTTAEIIINALIEKVSSMTAVAVGDVDPRRAVASFGLDSLISMEIRGWVLRELGADITAKEVLNATSLEDLAALVTARRNVEIGSTAK